MIARARAVAHGNAYTTYATLKKDAEFVCCENMAGDMDMDAETAKQKADEHKARIEYAECHHFVCEPVNPDTKKEHFEFDHSIGDDKEAEHFTFDVSENILNAMCSTFKALEDEFAFMLEEVIETSLFVFFELMSVPGGSGYSSGGGGGENNDLPHKKKDDDDELLRANLCLWDEVW